MNLSTLKEKYQNACQTLDVLLACEIESDWKVMREIHDAAIEDLYKYLQSYCDEHHESLNDVIRYLKKKS